MLPPEKLPLQKYEERYCAYVDILGFSDLINRLKKGETDFTAVCGLLRVIHHPPFMVFSEVAEKSDFRAQQISDAVCISTICNAAGLDHLFAALTEMSMRLLHAGYFVRGALVKGILYHDDDMAFGDALIHAYKLEQEVRYPRVMITKEVAADLSAMTKRDKFGYNLRNSVALSDDGPRFLDVLLQLVVNLRDNKDGESRLAALARYNEMAAQIQLRFEESRDNPRHFEKVQWFARYWNRVAVPWGVNAITRPGSDGASTVHV